VIHKIAICAGHYPVKPGLQANGFSEHDEAVKVTKHLEKMLAKDGYEVRVTGGKLTDKVASINNFQSEIAIDIHFNGHEDDRVGGIETLHSGFLKSLRLAKCVQKRLVERLNRLNRDTKIGFYQGDPKRGLLYFLAHTHCPAIVTEGLFLSNAEEAMMLETENTHILYATAIAEGINDYFIESLRRSIKETATN